VFEGEVIPGTLELCTDRHLKLLAAHLTVSPPLPLSELRELRALEQRLRAEKGDYRSRR